MQNTDNTNLTSPTPFAARPIPAIIELFQHDPNRFVETLPEHYEAYLKAEEPLVQHPNSFLLSLSFASIRNEHGNIVGLYPAFYCLGERLFVRLETVGTFNQWASVELIEEQFGLLRSRPFKAMIAAYEAGDPRFFETIEDTYDDQLGAVPPEMMNPGSFLTGEPTLHASEGGHYIAIYNAFYCVDGRYFCRLESPTTFGARASVALIREQFSL